MRPIRKLARTAVFATWALALPALAQDPTTAAAAQAPPVEVAPAAAPRSEAPRSELMPLAASQALVLDIAEADSRAIAVGERGQIFLSESRRDWRQVADVPTRANLTAVSAIGDLAWAVGHDGVILHSTDGGLSWSVQRSDAWRRADPDEPFNPRQGVPLLDVLMLDASNGLAIGAYSLMLRTRDGGASWEEVDIFSGATQPDPATSAPESDADAASDDDSWTFDDSDLELEEESDPHLNAIARTGDGSLLIVAERGTVFRSTDGGTSWERRQLPYEGSMFGVLGYEGRRVLAFGMRGNAFESDDLGETWTELDTGTELSLMGGTALPQGGAALVGANGVVIVRPQAGAATTRHTFQTAGAETPVLSSVVAQSPTALVVGGEKGIGQFQVPAQAQ